MRLPQRSIEGFPYDESIWREPLEQLHFFVSLHSLVLPPDESAYRR